VGKEFWRNTKQLKRVKQPFCSYQCNGKVRGQEWAKHGYKGIQGWTKETYKSVSEKMRGANNPAWKGGVTYFKKKGNYTGVRYIKCLEDFYLPMARKDGYIMEHRLVMAQHLRRLLKRTEVVHHINHDPSDNRIENLMLFKNNYQHKKYEALYESQKQE